MHHGRDPTQRLQVGVAGIVRTAERPAAHANNSWNDFYKKEIENFADNEDDTGECWFDDSDAERKVVQFFCGLLEDGEVASTLTVADLGTGNGHFLFELFDTVSDEVEDAQLAYHGIDYSPELIEFAKKIAEKKYPEQEFTFEEVDFISKECAYLENNAGKFDVLFDKGTLDAIALNNDPVPGFGERIGTQVYPTQVARLMHKGSLLIVTSCNFTEDELTKVITQGGSSGLAVWRRIEYPSFQFGGAKGSTICSIAFVKQ